MDKMDNFFNGEEIYDEDYECKTKFKNTFKNKNSHKLNILSAVNTIVQEIRDFVDKYEKNEIELDENKGYMENILSLVEKTSKKEIAHIAKKFHISKRQAILLACIIDCRFETNRIRTKYLSSSYFGAPIIIFLECNDDLLALSRERIITYDTVSGNVYCDRNFTNIVLNDGEYTKTDYSCLSEGAVIEQLMSVFCTSRNNNNNPPLSVKIWIDEIMETANKEYGFIKYFKKLREKIILDEDYYTFLFFCVQAHRHENWFNDSYILTGCYPVYGDNEDDLRNYIENFISKHSQLWENELVDYVTESGTIHKDCYSIKNEVLEEVYSTEPILYTASEGISFGGSLRNVIEPENISEKELYYNEEESEKVAKLESILQEENFSNVVERLKEQGMRCGFSCIFYGPPGTGKTETALQLARKTGRKIFSINVSDLKSMWVGESEKMVKRTFVDYKKMVDDKSEKTPILFFNEADAVFGKRNTNAEMAVDKMENSIQNIILDEMDKFEGILIATTNITNLFDKAFERRFLYKIYFDNPCEEAKSKIWKSMVPDLTEANARLIASRYDLSGGQIENIARKAKIDYILNGDKVTVEKIDNYCSDEKLENNFSKGSIGFKR